MTNYYVDRISATRFDMHGACPQQYYRRYCLGEKIAPGIALHTGTAFHAASELNFKEKIETGEDQPLDVLQDCARDAFVQRVRDEGVFVPLDKRPSAMMDLAAAQDMAIDLVVPFRNEFAPSIDPAFVEEGITFTEIGLPPIIAYPDTVTKTGRLCEEKTSARRWSQHRADTATQPTVYREAIKRHTGKYPRFISIDQFVKSSKPFYFGLATQRNGDDWRVMVERFKFFVGQVATGLFPPADPEHWKCSPMYCGYWHTCKYISPHRRVIPKRSV